MKYVHFLPTYYTDVLIYDFIGENEWSGIEFEEFETKPDICTLEASTSQGQNLLMENVETVNLFTFTL